MVWFRRFKAFLGENNEFWGIPIGVALFVIVPTALRWLDPTAAPFDVGVLHALIFGVAGFLVVKGAAWLFLAMDFPDLYHYLDKRLTGIEGETARRRVSLVLYFGYMLLMAIMVIAVL